MISVWNLLANEDQTGFSTDDWKLLKLLYAMLDAIMIYCDILYRATKGSPWLWSPDHLCLVVSGQGPSHPLPPLSTLSLSLSHTHTHTHTQYCQVVRPMYVPPPKFIVCGVRCVVVAVTIEVCDLSGVFVSMQIASFMTNFMVYYSILQSPQNMGWSSIQVCSCMVDLFREAFDARAFTCFELMCSLANVHFSQVHGISLTTFASFSVGGIFHFASGERRVGPDLYTALMLKSLHTLLILSLMPAT